jgi:hypothetical protein
MRFSLEPLSGPDNFLQWCDSIKAANRMSSGIPAEIRKRVGMNSF